MYDVAHIGLNRKKIVYERSALQGNPTVCIALSSFPFLSSVGCSVHQYYADAASCCGALHCGSWPDHPKPVQALSQQGYPELCLCKQLEDSHGGSQALQAVLVNQEEHQGQVCQPEPYEGKG